MTSRKSGLQKEVLALYRRALRMASTKPPSAQPRFFLFVRFTFRQQSASVSSRDVAAIEHLIRKGRRQIEAFEDKSVKDCWVSAEMKHWESTHRGYTPWAKS
ncbi:hypothetical protein EYR40_009451 [Pleurotus pulmonarius]|nr:hypothetical protein EYR38_009449 [Pleurotus pulmonarius]KAF4590854.1 hypothetical protein EYR40_009451 [Pleurotus pulmonarius]